MGPDEFIEKVFYDWTNGDQRVTGCDVGMNPGVVHVTLDDGSAWRITVEPDEWR